MLAPGHNLAGRLLQIASDRGFGDRIALRQGEQRWTYEHLADQVRRVATVLRQLNVGRGQRGFGGLLAGNRIKSGWTVNRTRKSVIALGGVIMLISLLATTQAATPIVAVLLMAAILFGFQTAVGNIQTLPSDFYSGKSVGTLAGYAGTAAKLAVVGLNFLIPIITVNSYAPAFIVGAGLAIMTVLSVLILCPDIKPLKPKIS